MNIRLDDDDAIELPIVPMIDCAFLLLVFFLIATTLKKPDNMATVYKITVPKAESPQTVSTEHVWRVLVTADGIVIPGAANKTDQTYGSLTELVTDLGVYKESTEKEGHQPMVLITCDKDAKFQRVIQVWNAVKTAGISQVSFPVVPGKADEALSP
jgi:biopolymer transport protein ExbD